ncbi:Serine/threonine phosphatase stp [bacterium HR40]|nr:Serine/threonine phosphatase stp [bacterium HR40]
MWVARSHPGWVRQRNEDAFIGRPEIGLFAVADGMGGLVAGDRASRAAIDALARIPPQDTLVGLDREVERALTAVHEQLRDAVLEVGPCGTTVVVLLLAGEDFRVLWCGDSRAGRLRAGRLEWLTTDHNLAAQLVRSGRLADEEARRHPLASRLTRALGCYPELQLERVAGRVSASDLFLLCTDGLTGELRDAEIASALAGSDLETMADCLSRAALAGNAHDNITFLLVRP